MCWNSIDVEQLFTASSMSAFVFNQYSESHESSLAFTLLTWLLCSCLNALGCSYAVIIVHLLFIAIPSIITTLSLNVQLGHMSCFTSASLDSQLCATYVFRFCMYVLLRMQGCLLLHQWHLYSACTLFVHLCCLLGSARQPLSDVQLGSLFVYCLYIVCILYWFIRAEYTTTSGIVLLHLPKYWY